jgi:DNA-binding response OmpR family regulator
MGKLIFFVDDDKMILNLLDYTFNNRDGYTVKTFRSGENLLEIIGDKPDLIVLDHSFDVENSAYSNGFEILEKIREKNKTVPVIILSGEHNQNIISNYLKLGVNKFINKDSFFVDSLIEAVKESFNPV